MYIQLKDKNIYFFNQSILLMYIYTNQVNLEKETKKNLYFYNISSSEYHQ